MAQGLQEKAGLEQKVTRQADELRRLSEERGYLLEKTITAQEEERKRIARELHDDFAQTLTALTIGLETALQTLPPEIAPLREQLARVQDLTTTTLGQTHRWIQDLRPRMLDDLGLVPAIRWYAETRLEAIGVQVQLEVSRFKGRLSPELETTLFRVIQEAINNVAKHAQARHVRIRLEFADARVLAEVEDDGVGFDPQAFLAVHEGTRGIGLLGMRERVTLVGGLLTVDSRPGRGTHIRIEVPWTA
jgi:signal transduction histidine kinase